MQWNPMKYLSVIVIITALTDALICDIPSNISDSTPFIQNCIDSVEEGGVLQLPVGLFILQSGLSIEKSLTLTSVQSSEVCDINNLAGCTVLQASESFYSPFGLIRAAGGLSGVALDHLVIDGNRDERLYSESAQECTMNIGNRDGGRNIVFESCTNCRLSYSIVMNALCASAFVWIGDYITVNNNLIMNNGDHFSQLMWADGLTCLQCDHAQIFDNSFADNSDIDLIMGSAIESHVYNNKFSHDDQSNRPAFGSVMCDNFSGSTSGKFNGLVFEYNNINCGKGLCCFGLELGPHPWYLSAPIGGNFTVRSNVITGAGVGINVDAAGQAGEEVIISDNTITGTQKQFSCGALCPSTRSGSSINVSPDSVVQLQAGNQATSHTTYACV